MADLMTSALLRAIRRKVAVSAIPPSAMRNQGAPGVAAAARAFLAELPLRPFASPRPERFADALERATRQMCRALPERACAWGTSRKAVNLFLRDCFYNKFLHDHYGLGAAEALFEIPLDGIVAKELTGLPGGPALSPWLGVKHLTPAQSAEYQAFALGAATEQGIARVHLDTILWPAFTRRATTAE